MANDVTDAAPDDRLRLVFEFVSRWHEDHRPAELIAVSAPSTMSAEWDALIAGLVEHLAGVRGLTVPAWVDEPHRFIDGAWWVIDTPLFRV